MKALIADRYRRFQAERAHDGTPGKITRDGGLRRLCDRIEFRTRGSMDASELACLYKLAARAKHCIIEIGTAQGRSTIALALGAINGAGSPVYAIDPHDTFVGPLGGKYGPSDRAAALKNFLRFDVAENVHLVNLPSSLVAAAWTLPVDLVLVDGDHKLDAVRKDCDDWLPFLVDGGVVLLDDTHIPGLGPDIVADELAKNGHFEEITVPGKMRGFRCSGH